MTNAYYLCDCGNRLTLPSKNMWGKNAPKVVGLSCGECKIYWNINYQPSKLLGVVSEWRCSGCNTNQSRCRDMFNNVDRCKNQK